MFFALRRHCEFDECLSWGNVNVILNAEDEVDGVYGGKGLYISFYCSPRLMDRL